VRFMLWIPGVGGLSVGGGQADPNAALS